MPEEHNRVMIDHISDFLFAPTEEAKRNLIADNVKGKIFVTGNTIVNAVKQNLAIARKKSHILERLSLKPKDYFLLTIHREENVDLKENLRSILDGVKLVVDNSSQQVIFPAHPRTQKRLKYFGLNSLASQIKNLTIIQPLGYLDFLFLLSNSRLVLTDSGGIQEESCILGVPCVTLRDSTERPETVEVGANYIAGLDSLRIFSGVESMSRREGGWENPFGKDAARKIVDIVDDFLRSR